MTGSFTEAERWETVIGSPVQTLPAHGEARRFKPRGVWAPSDEGLTAAVKKVYGDKARWKRVEHGYGVCTVLVWS